MGPTTFPRAIEGNNLLEYATVCFRNDEGLRAKCSTLDAADRAELRDLSRDAGEGAGIDDVRHILVSLGDFLIHGAVALAADNDTPFLHLANNVAARGS